MDHALALPIWDELDTGLIFFWLALLMMVATAVSFLLAHAILPSLVGTRDLPQGFAKLRPGFLCRRDRGVSGGFVSLLHNLGDGFGLS